MYRVRLTLEGKVVKVSCPIIHRELTVVDEQRSVNISLSKYFAKVQPPNPHKFILSNQLTNITIASGAVGSGSEASYTVRFDDVDLNTFYFGQAIPGSKEDEAVWRIRKGINRMSDLATLWPNGDSSFAFKWSERTSFTYK